MEVITTMDTRSSFRKKEVWNNLQEAFGMVPLVWQGRGQKGHAQSLILGLHPHLLLYWSDVAVAKSLQSSPTLCDPIDSSPPGSPVPGILQARVLEWVAIAFSAWSDEAIANTLLLAVLRRDRKQSFFFVHVGVVDGTETIIMSVMESLYFIHFFFSTHYNQDYSLSLIKSQWSQFLTVKSSSVWVGCYASDHHRVADLHKKEFIPYTNSKDLGMC